MEADHSRFEYAGAAGGWLDGLGYIFARGRVFDHCEPDSGQYDSTAPVAWASGAALFVRADVYHACGGLDGYFFAHMEEIDLCWRMQRSGYKVMACPQSVVFHVGGGTLPRGNARKTFLNYRNNLIMLWKNLPAGQLALKLPLRLLLDALSAWKALLVGGDGGYFMAVVKAHLGLVYWCLFVKNMHRELEAKRGWPPNGHFTGSIVWAYFVKKRQKFSEIVTHKPM